MSEVDRLIQKAMQASKPGEIKQKEDEIEFKTLIFKEYVTACRDKHHGEILVDVLKKCRDEIHTNADTKDKDKSVENIIYMAADIFLQQCSLEGMKIVEKYRKAQNN